MDPMTRALILRKANSMQIFADGDATFSWGDWKAWEAACFAEGRTVPPAEFKALPEEARRAYLEMPNPEVNGREPGERSA